MDLIEAYILSTRPLCDQQFVFMRILLTDEIIACSYRTKNRAQNALGETNGLNLLDLLDHKQDLFQIYHL